MDLKGREEAIRIYAQRGRHPRTVLGNFIGGVSGADPAVEGGVYALRYATRPREKGVSNA
jgi:hypothetical protein